MRSNWIEFTILFSTLINN